VYVIDQRLITNWWVSLSHYHPPTPTPTHTHTLNTLTHHTHPPTYTHTLKLYRYDQFPSNNEMITDNYNELCFQLTHDLITHYNSLGNECRDRKDEGKAKEMFLNAHKLCELPILF
jgi:hypothetical protein